MISDESKNNEDMLCGIFKDIRKSDDTRFAMGALVQQLEYQKTLSSCHYGKHYQTFCEAYMIELLNEYVHDTKEREILLAVYGLLDGYREERITGRCEKYAKEASKFDKSIKSDWAVPNDSLRKRENKKIMPKLIKEIAAAMTKDKKLDADHTIAEKVDKELLKKFPNGLPDELPLRQPLYLSSNQPPRSTADNTDEKGIIPLGKKHNWELIIIIVVVVLAISVGIMAFGAKKGSDQDSIDNSSRQNNSPAKINYPDGISVDVSGSVSVSRGEKGEVIITYIDDGFGAIDNKDSDSQKGVDNHEKNQ